VRGAAPAIAALLALCACAPSSAPDRSAATGLEPDALGLQPNGTTLRIDFGRAEAGAVPVAARLLGEDPVYLGPVAGCALTAARWDDGLTMWFDRGSFVGWTDPARGSAGEVCALA
jgi:hypothetical protein